MEALLFCSHSHGSLLNFETLEQPPSNSALKLFMLLPIEGIVTTILHAEDLAGFYNNLTWFPSHVWGFLYYFLKKILIENNIFIKVICSFVWWIENKQWRNLLSRVTDRRKQSPRMLQLLQKKKPIKRAKVIVPATTERGITLQTEKLNIRLLLQSRLEEGTR